MSLTGPSLPSSLSSVTADSSVPSTSTTLSASSSGQWFLLAENRYGREDKLTTSQRERREAAQMCVCVCTHLYNPLHSPPFPCYLP